MNIQTVRISNLVKYTCIFSNDKNSRKSWKFWRTVNKWVSWSLVSTMIVVMGPKLKPDPFLGHFSFRLSDATSHYFQRKLLLHESCFFKVFVFKNNVNKYSFCNPLHARIAPENSARFSKSTLLQSIKYKVPTDFQITSLTTQC